MRLYAVRLKPGTVPGEVSNRFHRFRPVEGANVHLRCVVVIEELRGSIDDKEPFFLPKCECGWRGSVWLTKNEAFAEAYTHDSNVSDELTYSVHEPGHVLCLFCGDQIEIKTGLITLIACWTEEDGQEQEQMFWAHRQCLIEHASDDEWVGGPLWGT